MAELQNTRKRYFVKVFTASGNYIGTYKGIGDKFQYTQAINSPGSTATITLARSANSMIESRQTLTDSTGATYTDTTGNPYAVTVRTKNTVGPDTDVYNGHLIEVYVTYGRYETFTDSMGRPYTDSTGQPYQLGTGSPLGRAIFRGKIIKWKATYKRGASSVTVTIASHGIELSRGEVVKSGAATTVAITSAPIENVIKSILDTNPGRVSYSATSIATTGVSINAKFQLNTKLQAIQSTVDQTNAGWYWYVDPADNLLYLQPRATVADHIFYRRKHLETIEIEEDASELRNKVYFVGGTKSDGSTLYNVYADTAASAQWGLGTYVITDRRFTVDASAARYAAKIMSRYARPVYTSTIRIPSATYDTESIKLGQVVTFRDFGNFIDSQVLQIVNRVYHPDYVELQLGELLDDQKGLVVDVQDDLLNEQFANIPTTPL